jgi:hypothetical protein
MQYIGNCCTFMLGTPDFAVSPMAALNTLTVIKKW